MLYDRFNKSNVRQKDIEMNKIMHAGILILSFSHTMQSTDHKETPFIKDLVTQVHNTIHIFDHGFDQILFHGNAEGYRNIEQATLKVQVPEHADDIAVEEIITFLNTQVDSIVKFIQGRPTTKEKVLPYMLQFKNKVNLIDLITFCIGHLNNIYQDLTHKGRKKDAALVRKLIIFATEVRSKWVNRSNNDPMKLLENLRNSLK